MKTTFGKMSKKLDVYKLPIIVEEPVRLIGSISMEVFLPSGVEVTAVSCGKKLFPGTFVSNILPDKVMIGWYNTQPFVGGEIAYLYFKLKPLRFEFGNKCEYTDAAGSVITSQYENKQLTLGAK